MYNHLTYKKIIDRVSVKREKHTLEVCFTSYVTVMKEKNVTHYCHASSYLITELKRVLSHSIATFLEQSVYYE